MDALDVLQNLQSKKNVILMGAPGTGKSKMMNEVAGIFETGVDINPTPTHFPGARIPIPAIPENSAVEIPSMLQRAHRKVFRTDPGYR